MPEQKAHLWWNVVAMIPCATCRILLLLLVPVPATINLPAKL